MADRIENNEIEDGFHPMVKKIGEAVGEVYIAHGGCPAEDFNAWVNGRYSQAQSTHFAARHNVTKRLISY